MQLLNKWIAAHESLFLILKFMIWGRFMGSEKKGINDKGIEFLLMSLQCNAKGFTAEERAAVIGHRATSRNYLLAEWKSHKWSSSPYVYTANANMYTQNIRFYLFLGCSCNHLFNVPNLIFYSSSFTVNIHFLSGFLDSYNIECKDWKGPWR